MSRAAAGQLTTPSQHIFITEITQSDGTKTWEMSSQSLSDQSVRVNTRNNRYLLFALMALSSIHETGEGDNPYFQLSVINQLLRYRHTTPEVWGNVFEFLGPRPRSIGDYALSIRKPSLFSQIAMDPAFVVDAAMRGQEDMVLNILRADPTYLLKAATVKNSVDVESIRTPLQAAIMANDVQMAEKMKEHFERMDNGDAIMREQTLQIFKESLRMYCEKQDAEVTRLTALKTAGTAIDKTTLTTAIERRDAYETALRSDNMLDIFNAHTLAQKHNAFDFQPYVDAIFDPALPPAELDEVMALINAKTPEETQAAIAKGVSHIEIGFVKNGRAYTRAEVQAMPLSELTLVQKLNRFREKLTQHMQQEIIFNPNHILAGLTINETTWKTLSAQDPQFKKRSIIFSQLVGRVQGVASEPLKQDIRQGTYYLTEEKEPRSRPSRFNDHVPDRELVRNFLVDCSLVDSSSFAGLGFKFGGRGSGWRAAGAPALAGACRLFSKLMSSKNSGLEKLMQPTRAKARWACCAIQ